MIQWYADPQLPVVAQLLLDEDGDAAILTNPAMLRALEPQEAMNVVNRLLALVAGPNSGEVAPRPASSFRLCS